MDGLDMVDGVKTDGGEDEDEGRFLSEGRKGGKRGVRGD